MAGYNYYGKDLASERRETIEHCARLIEARIAEVVEECAKIAAPWQGAWLDHNSTETDREVVRVRQGIADAIRLLMGCHCGKDGHALNSINCPVHGYEIRMKMAQDLADWEI